MFLVWPSPCTGENETHGDLAGSSIVKMVGSGLGEAILKTHLRVGKVQELSTELPDQKLGPCEGILARGSNKD